jgi:hypothetical protein
MLASTYGGSWPFNIYDVFCYPDGRLNVIFDQTGTKIVTIDTDTWSPTIEGIISSDASANLQWHPANPTLTYLILGSGNDIFGDAYAILDIEDNYSEAGVLTVDTNVAVTFAVPSAPPTPPFWTNFKSAYETLDT